MSVSVPTGIVTAVPDFMILLKDKSPDVKDLTQVFAERIMSISVTDNRGFLADTMSLTLDDADGALALPARGVILQIALGWSDSDLLVIGEFTVDQLEYSGYPGVVTISGSSADFRDSLSARKEKSWHETTVGEIVTTIATLNNLTASVGNDISKIKIAHMDQTGESDSSFLTRLARLYGAITSVKNGYLLFIQQDKAQTASGQPLAQLVLTPQSGDRIHFSIEDRDHYTGVSAKWLDTRQPANKNRVEAVAANKTPIPDLLAGSSSEKVLMLNQTYATKEQAQQAAMAQWQQIQKGVASLSMTLARGRADLFAEMPVKVSGIKAEIDHVEWIISRLTHTVTVSEGFTTSLSLEPKSPIPELR